MNNFLKKAPSFYGGVRVTAFAIGYGVNLVEIISGDNVRLTKLIELQAPKSMSNKFQIRQARVDDVPQIFGLILALAEYEKLGHQVTGTAESLQEHLFGDCSYAESIVAELDNKVIAFALFFPSYSTFLTKPGIYLEDLFVLPEYRRQGIGKGILAYLGQLAIDRDAGRLEWSVLDWNESAIAFYHSMGAKVLPDWRICRISKNALQNFAVEFVDEPSTS